MITPNLLTVAQFSEKHTAFPIGGMRYRIFNEHENGLAESEAIIRIGRKVLIDEARFFDWILSNRMKTPITSIPGSAKYPYSPTKKSLTDLPESNPTSGKTQGGAHE
jgi:hypothetical protein